MTCAGFPPGSSDGSTWFGGRRSASGSTAGGPPSSADGKSCPSSEGGNAPPRTLIRSALMVPEPSRCSAELLSELTTIPPPLTSISPRPVSSSASTPAGSSTQSTQLLGAAGPAPAAAIALMLFERFPSTGANAYCTVTGGVITRSAFDPAGQRKPGGGSVAGGGLGRVQQTTSPLSSTPSSAQPAGPGVTRFLPSSSSTVVIAAAGPSTVSRDAPARAAESAAVCTEVRAAQLSPTSTTSAASPSSTVRASATVMATLPRSEPPRSRNIVGHRPRSGSRQPVRVKALTTRKQGPRSLSGFGGARPECQTWTARLAGQGGPDASSPRHPGRRRPAGQHG